MNAAAIEKIVVVTRKTRLEELVERFNTLGQARFYIEHAGGDFREYAGEAEVYRQAVALVRSQLDFDLKVQFIDRGFLPTYLFTAGDLIVTLGQDGLVANTAKYVRGQPIVALNPDPERMDGVLLPWRPDQVHTAAAAVLAGKARSCGVTMAEAVMNDGQSMLAFNDLFIGARSHISARYRIRAGGKSEQQSSSGILVSTGAGSTGWMSSVFNMARGLAAFGHAQPPRPVRMTWEDPRLLFVAREPFVSRHSTAEIVAGLIAQGQELLLESLMPSGGCIFSDGIEADFVEFNAGSVARIRTAAQQAHLVVA
jgi:NAD kinase